MEKTEMECPYCGYKWVSRKPKPKTCPYCSRYFKIGSLKSTPGKREIK